MARRRPQNLTEAELRVLAAFKCGRLSAGRLSAELARARRDRPTAQPVFLQPRVDAPALQNAA